MPGLGERGSRLRRLAAKLDPPPKLPPYFVQLPDEADHRAIGWYMRLDSSSEPEFLGHSAISAEMYLRERLSTPAR